MKYGVFVWDADGDMGEGVVLGSFKTQARAYYECDRVHAFTEREGRPSINAMLIPIIHPSKTTMSMVSDAVFGDHMSHS